MDIKEIKQNYRIEDVIGRSIHLKKQGPELVGNCIFHNDVHSSLKVNPQKQIFKCFACGAGKDIFDFFTLQGYSLAEAGNLITSESIITHAEPQPKEPEVIWEDVTDLSNKPSPDIKNLTFKDYGKPSNFWAYTNEEGMINGYVLRFDLPGGKKDVIPYTYKKRTEKGVSKTGWFWRGFEIKRPLYNLHELKARPDAIVLVVEGEKTADAGKILFPQYVVTTWIGGGENVKNADLSPLEGRRVYLWADNDVPGITCIAGGWVKNETTGIYRRVKGLSELVKADFKFIRNSPEFPKKWDIADADWTPEQALEYLKANRTEVPLVSENPPGHIPEPVAPITPPKPEVVPTQKPKSKNDNQPKNPFFRCLGFENNDQNLYIFFVYRTNVIVKLSAGGISTSNILQLAPLNFWEGNFPKQTRSGGVKFEINTIADTLITQCSRIGIFNPKNIRGLGAWKDGENIVIHCGTNLIVNGVEVEFSKHRSKYIYEARQEIDVTVSNPLSKSEAYKTIQILERLNWSREVNARLLAGWIVIAPLCGALNWRPHLWITGASGTGKSWIMKNVIKKLLGDGFVDAQSETTEAGIRQFLKADALPVIFDEAESEDRRGQERIQSVLNIMRSSSTSDSGKIIKGSAGGNAAEFSLRSCFAFASIGANLTQRSDVSRISVLEVKPDISTNKREKWEETVKFYNENITEKYVESFRSRSLNMLPVILENAKVFSNAAAAVLDNQRAGDQLGALLAGAYSLTSDKVISFEDATKWINERDWSEERLMDSTRDEVKVLNKIIDSETSVETLYGNKTRTIGEIIMISLNKASKFEQDLISQDMAEAWLKRLGIKIENDFIIISDNSEFVRKSLVNSAYSKNYHTILCRITGAEKTTGTRFGSYLKSRATKIPLFEVFGEIEKPEKKFYKPQPLENTQTEIKY